MSFLLFPNEYLHYILHIAHFSTETWNTFDCCPVISGLKITDLMCELIFPPNYLFFSLLLLLLLLLKKPNV